MNQKGYQVNGCLTKQKMLFENPILRYLEQQKPKPVEILCIDEKPVVDTKTCGTQTESEFSKGSFWQNLLTDYYSFIILLIVLPLSFLSEAYMEVRDWGYRNFLFSNNVHEKRVKDVQEQVKEWNQKELKGRRLMSTARPRWKTLSTRLDESSKDDFYKIHLNLTDILYLDREHQTVKTEPSVSIRSMKRYLLPKGYQLAVQPGMDDATIGGLCMDVGKASTSHRFGLFHETVVSYDIVTANGNLLHVTRDNYPDLFYTLPCSHGSLGLLVAVELKVIPTKSYVHVNYLPCYEPNDLYLRMKQLTESEFPPDFVEGIVYSEKESVLMFSYFIDANIMTDWNKFNFINLFWRPWYHEHTKKALERGPFSEYIPIEQYHSRFSRSLLWEMQHLIPFSNQTWYRYCFGWLGAPKVSYLKKFMPPRIRKEIFYQHVLQDTLFPLDRVLEAKVQLHEWFNVYPLLLCPVAIYDHSPYEGLIRNPVFSTNETLRQLYCSVGIFGVPRLVKQNRFWNAEEKMKEFEEYLLHEDGYKSLCSDSLMTDKEIRTMLNHAIYDKLREEYGCVGAFPDIHEKTKTTEIVSS